MNTAPQAHLVIDADTGIVTDESKALAKKEEPQTEDKSKRLAEDLEKILYVLTLFFRR